MLGVFFFWGEDSFLLFLHSHSLSLVGLHYHLLLLIVTLHMATWVEPYEPLRPVTMPVKFPLPPLPNNIPCTPNGGRKTSSRSCWQWWVQSWWFLVHRYETWHARRRLAMIWEHCRVLITTTNCFRSSLVCDQSEAREVPSAPKSFLTSEHRALLASPGLIANDMARAKHKGRGGGTPWSALSRMGSTSHASLMIPLIKTHISKLRSGFNTILWRHHYRDSPVSAGDVFLGPSMDNWNCK